MTENCVVFCGTYTCSLKLNLVTFFIKSEQEYSFCFKVPLYLIKSLNLQRCVSVDGFIIAIADCDTHQIVFDEGFTQPSTFQIRHLPKCIKTGHES